MRLIIHVAFLISFARSAYADDLLFSFDGDRLPSDPQSGMIVADPCNPPCQESLHDGFFRVSFPPFCSGELANYHRWITQPPDALPSSLWVEWRFRSNHQIPTFSYTCDGSVTVRFRETLESVWLYGDAGLSFGLDDLVLDLPPEEFFTLRYESLDGIEYRFSIDGGIFSSRVDNNPLSGFSYFQMTTAGGCTNDWIPNKYNEWDFVRYGTIGFGEHIIAADPQIGFLSPSVFGEVDRFIITYDSPAFAYIDDIDVEVSGGATPQVIATKRIDNGPADVLQIILDRPLPAGERTTFTFNDGEAINVVAYTFQPGDINADGQWNLADFAALQNCFFQLPTATNCAAFDFDVNLVVDPADYSEFFGIMAP